MRAGDIHVGESYVVETAPRHPIKRPRLVEVIRITTDGITVMWDELTVVDRSTYPVTCGVRTRKMGVQPGQFLRTAAEQAERAAAEAERAAFWPSYRQHAATAHAAQILADAAVPADLVRRPFDGRPRRLHAVAS